MNGRIEHIDNAKAIGILLVILGHCEAILSFPILFATIYSFHMPMFFLISRYFSTPRRFYIALMKYADAYLKPLVIISLLAFIIAIISDIYRNIPLGHTFIQFKHALAYMDGGRNLKIDEVRLGPFWFLYALFWGSLLLNLIMKVKFRSVLILFVFCISVISRDIMLLLFSIQAGMCALLVMYIGTMLKARNYLKREQPAYIIIGLIVIWISSILLGLLYMKDLKMGIGLLAIPGTICGSVVVIMGCKYIRKSFLRWVGRNTLYLLCGHVLSFELLKVCGFRSFGQLTIAPLQLAVEFVTMSVMAIGLGYALTFLPILKKTYAWR